MGGGSLKEILIAGAIADISAGIAYGIGETLGHGSSFLQSAKDGGNWAYAAGKAVAHGVSRAVITKVQGGKFSAGFWSGFVASGFSVGTKGFGGFAPRTAIMAMMSGTTSVISGGKFANGAVSGAFIHMFNAELGNALAIAKENNRIQKMSGDEFRTKMNYVGTDDDIVISKLSLDQDFRSPFISELGKAASSGANIVYSSHPINASPKSILGFSGWLSTDSSLTFAYDCHSVSSCNVKIYK